MQISFGSFDGDFSVGLMVFFFMVIVVCCCLFLLRLETYSSGLTFEGFDLGFVNSSPAPVIGGWCCSLVD